MLLYLLTLNVNHIAELYLHFYNHIDIFAYLLTPLKISFVYLVMD